MLEYRTNDPIKYDNKSLAKIELKSYCTIVWWWGDTSDYRAMHFSAKRGIAIACRLSVCNVGGLWSHSVEYTRNNFTIS